MDIFVISEVNVTSVEFGFTLPFYSRYFTWLLSSDFQLNISGQTYVSVNLKVNPRLNDV